MTLVPQLILKSSNYLLGNGSIRVKYNKMDPHVVKVTFGELY